MIGLKADLIELGTQGASDHEEALAELALALRYAQDYDYALSVVHVERAQVLMRRLKKTAKQAYTLGRILEAQGSR